MVAVAVDVAVAVEPAAPPPAAPPAAPAPRWPSSPPGSRDEDTGRGAAEGRKASAEATRKEL